MNELDRQRSIQAQQDWLNQVYPEQARPQPKFVMPPSPLLPECAHPGQQFMEKTILALREYKEKILRELIPLDIRDDFAKAVEWVKMHSGELRYSLADWTREELWLDGCLIGTFVQRIEGPFTRCPAIGPINPTGIQYVYEFVPNIPRTVYREVIQDDGMIRVVETNP